MRGIRKLKKYMPTKFKAKDSVYNKAAADYAVNFDGEGMTVTFAPYEIACYAAGTQEFRLDRDFLGQYLSAEGLRLLGYEE